MLTTAKDVPRHVAAALKNVEGWLGNRAISNFFGFLEIIISLLTLPLPPLHPPSRQMC
jgi:hypothetical protein